MSTYVKIRQHKVVAVTEASSWSRAMTILKPDPKDNEAVYVRVSGQPEAHEVAK